MPQRVRQAIELTAALLLYALLAVAATWPLVRGFSTYLIGDIWFDQRHSVWMLWHIKEALSGRQSLFQADLLYYPHGISTLVDGVGIVSGLFALPFWPWGPAAAYNGAHLIGLTLSGWCMYLLVRYGSASAMMRASAIPPETGEHQAPAWRLRAAAFLAGAVFLLYPIHLIGFHGHIEKVFVGVLPLSMLAGLFAYDPARSRGWWAAPGLTLLLALMHNANQFMFAALGLVVLAGICAVTRVARRTYVVAWPVVRRAVAAGVLSLVIVGPMLIKVAGVARDPALETAYAQGSVRFLPDVFQYVTPSMHQALGWWFYEDGILRMESQSRRSIWPALNAEVNWQGCGIETAATIPLSAIALAIVAWRARYHGVGRWILFAAVFAGLALGPYLRIAGWSAWTVFDLRIPLPYALLVSIPGFDVLRTPVRFMMIGGVAVAILSAWGLVALMARSPRRARLVAAAMTAIVILECWPRPWPQQAFPPVPEFYQRLGRDPKAYAVLDLPSAFKHQDLASLYMYYQTVHGKGIAWAYLSRSYLEYPVSGVEAVFEASKANAADTRARLAELGYRYVVWHKRAEEIALRLAPGPRRALHRIPAFADAHPLIRNGFAGEQPMLEDDLIAVYRVAP